MAITFHETTDKYRCEIHGDVGAMTAGWTDADGKEFGPWCMHCIADMLNSTCRIAELVEEPADARA
jgi:hypothetical protein